MELIIKAKQIGNQVKLIISAEKYIGYFFNNQFIFNRLKFPRIRNTRYQPLPKILTEFGATTGSKRCYVTIESNKLYEVIDELNKWWNDICKKAIKEEIMLKDMSKTKKYASYSEIRIKAK